jgi:predicted nucleic acid-binding protein
VKYIVDANVLSEVTKPAPDPRVERWLRENEQELAVNPIVLGELEYGILLLPPSSKRTRLEEWFANVVKRIHNLDFDVACSSTWARLLAKLKKKGLAMPVKDSLIAATAQAHNLIVATRNTHDFRNAGVKVEDPFGS